MKIITHHFVNHPLTLLLLPLLMLCNCQQKQQEQPREKAQAETPGIFAVDTLKQSPTQASADIDTANSIIRFPDFAVVFPVKYQDIESLQGIQPEEGVSISLATAFGESIEGQTLHIKGDRLTNISVDQQYETSMFIQTEEGIYTMENWKHFTSRWEPLTISEDHTFDVLSYSAAERQKFLKVSKKEIEAAIRKHHEGMGEELISGGWPQEIDISTISLRIRATTRTGKRIETWLTFSFEYNC